MGCYINENEAKTALENVAKEFTNDYLIYIRKRVTKNTIKKTVTFAVVFLYSEKNEQIYNEYLKYGVNDDKETKILQSETFLENAAKKEIFFIECLIDGLKG